MHPNFGRAFQELRSVQPGGGLQNSGPARTAAAAATSPPRARRAGTLPRRRADHSPASCPGALTCSRAPSTHGEARPQEPVPGSGSAPRTQHARAPHAPRLRAHTHTHPRFRLGVRHVRSSPGRGGRAHRGYLGCAASGNHYLPPPRHWYGPPCERLRS